MTRGGWDRASLQVVLGLCLIKVVVHLALVFRYGYHGDELYFIECGRNLAFGYVDHPPLIPWIARVADEIGGGLLVLRIPAIAAGVGTLLLTALLVRDWGGGFRAQLLALLCVLVAPAHLRVAAMLNIPVIEVFLCTACAYLVSRALRRGERWTWILAGATLGLAILAKHSSVVWGGALIVGIVATPARRVLATPWPWAGVAVALAFAAPNLAWQIDNGFPTLEFIRMLRGEVLHQQGRGLFVAGQLLYFFPLAAPVWIAGAVWGFTARGRVAQPFALLFVTLFAFYLVSGGKPYYLASAYPPVLAAGGIAIERWLATRTAIFRGFIGAITAIGAAFALITLPALPLRSVDGVLGSLLGWAVPPMALTHDLHGMHGWEEHAATVDRVFQALPAEERDRASVLAGSYSQASAVNVLRSPTTPRAVSGSMTYFLWGADGTRGEVLIAYGVSRATLERHYLRCTETARIDAPLARPWDTDLPVYVCRDLSTSMEELLREVRRFGHMPRDEQRRPTTHSSSASTASPDSGPSRQAAR